MRILSASLFIPRRSVDIDITKLTVVVAVAVGGEKMGVLCKPESS